MRVNPRTMLVQRADAEIRLETERLAREHGLTSLELCQILNSHQASVMKYMLRAERHPDDPDKPADEA